MDVYAEACSLLDAAQVRYLVIGGMGANLHMTDRGVIVLTEDCDLLIPPELEGLQRAVHVLKGAGFELECGGEPLVDDDVVILQGVLRGRVRIRALKDGAPIDLPLQAAGLDFESCWKRHTRRRMDGALVRVAPLADIVRSKLQANRPKDRLFLETYRDRLAEMMRDAKADIPPDLGP